ncbi:MAG: Flp pilus assembly complex ATPase component TadA [Proteobacteria bacterium]|nr:Flp pilus assembly complex ATPase component TadA [Pseudomonadota bacterium]
MFAIIVTEKGGDQRRLEFDKSEVTIGRVQGNDVILPKGNVSKRHARIVLKDGKFIIVDLKSTNGTYVNGRKITSPLVVKDNDKIYIGDFILGVDGARTGTGANPDYPAPPPPVPPPETHSPGGPPPRPGGLATSPRPTAQQVRAQPQSGPSGPAPVPHEGPSGPSGPPPPAPPLPGANRPRPAPVPMPSSAAAVAAEASAPAAPPAPQRPPLQPASPPRLVGVGAGAPQAVGPSVPRSNGNVSRPARVRPVGRFVQRGVQIEPLDPKVVRMLELQESILARLVPRLDLDNVPIERLGDESLWQKAESAIVDLVETLESSGELASYIDQDSLIKESLNEALGLGPLEDLLADESIDEIIVDRRDRILVNKQGSLQGSGRAFSSDHIFRRVVERLVAPSGHMINEASPLIDVRLRDGARIAAAVPPVAVRGACLTLRKPRRKSFTLDDLVQNGAMSAAMGDLLTTCINARRNLLICGAPGSGKRMVLTALARAIPPGERLVSVEEIAELALDRDEWIALEARPSDGNGLAEVNLDMVLRSALRMRADRLIVGDVRGSEALELISAMASSSDGTLLSLSGDGPESALSRLTSLARLAAPGAASDALRDLVSCAVDVVVHVARYADDVVRIASIAEVLGASQDGFSLQQVFAFRGTSSSGGFAAAGVVPTFYSELQARGMPADTSIFRG